MAKLLGLVIVGGFKLDAAPTLYQPILGVILRAINKYLRLRILHLDLRVGSGGIEKKMEATVEGLAETAFACQWL